MEEEATLSKMAMYVTQGCLAVPIQVELDDKSVLHIQGDILERVNKTGTKGVVIDVSGVAVIDSSLGRSIFDTARMASLLGVKTVITGLRPGVVASLIDLGFEAGDVPTAISLEEGLRMLALLVAPRAEPDEAEEHEEGAGEEDEGATDEYGELEANEEENDIDEE